MTSKQTTESALQEFFYRKKVATIEELTTYFQMSHRSVKRYLKELKSYSSYNHNSRYYVLPETVGFNKVGIWKYRGIGFSKYRSLKRIIIALVEQSSCGLSQQNLRELLECPTHQILSTYFKESPELLREQEGKQYIYFSKKAHVYAAQKQRRKELKQSELREQLPSDANAIVVLVERIKHPTDTPEQLTRRVRRRGIIISIDQIRSLLQYHSLLKKMVTPLLELLDSISIS